MELKNTLLEIQNQLDKHAFGKYAILVGYGDREWQYMSEGVDLDSYFDAASVGKVFPTSALALHAISEGLLSLYDTLEKYFPNVTEDKKNITVKNLMTHTSGMLRRQYPEKLGLRGREGVAEFIFSNPLAYETGTHYAYCCDGIMLLGFIVEKVFGMTLEEAFETFNSGERKNWTDDSLLRTARHEAGHALVCWLSGEKPTYLTVVARGDHGGYMQHANSEGKGSYTKAELLARIRTSLAGRACETVYYGDEEGLSTGASGDLRSATRTAESIVCRYGMDETGYAYIDTDRMDGVTAQVVRERVNAILKAEMENAVQAISENRLAINAIVQALMEKNHLREDEINEIFTRAIARNNK
jgi:hypothetical protein